MAVNEMSRRALVISGGGSKGAFAGGVAEFLIRDCGRDYDLYLGTSAGSLLVPLLALGEVDRLRTVFTHIRQQDIFNICPFIIRRHGKMISFSINHFNTVLMFLRRKKTFGESENLRHLIRRTFTLNDYEHLRGSSKEVIVTVANLSCRQVEYYSVHETSYLDFCDLMWISANVVPFMSLAVRNNMEYADGGFGSYLPLQEAIHRGATEVDAIILKPQEVATHCLLPTGNAFGLLLRTFDYMLDQISHDDLELGRFESLNQNVILNCYHTPYLLTENSFIFDPELMTAWWELGHLHARRVSPTCRKIVGGG